MKEATRQKKYAYKEGYHQGINRGERNERVRLRKLLKMLKKREDGTHLTYGFNAALETVELYL